MRNRTPIMSDCPNMFQIFINSSCNLRCSFCVPRQEAWHKNKVSVNCDSPDSNIDASILDRIAPFYDSTECLYLTGAGEPLLSNSFWDFIEGRRYSNSLFFNTNGTLLTDENITRLLQYKKKMLISISINAAKPATYKKIVGKDYFEKIIDNCYRLSKRNEEIGETCSIGYSMVVIKENLNEMVDFVKLVSQLKGTFATIQFAIFPYDYVWPYNKKFISKEQDIVSHPNLVKKYNKNYSAAQCEAKKNGIDLAGRGGDDSQFEGYCRELFDFLRIDQEGNTSACCHSWEINTGNIFDYPTIKKAWNNPQRIAMREQILNGDFPEQCKTMDCGYYRNAIYRKNRGLPKADYFLDQKFLGCKTEITLLNPNDIVQQCAEGKTILAICHVKNTGTRTWYAQQLEGVFAWGGRIFRFANEKASVAIKEFRSKLQKNIMPGDEVAIEITGDITDLEPGNYILCLNMLIEGEVWFQDVGSKELCIPFNIEGKA